MLFQSGRPGVGPVAWALCTGLLWPEPDILLCIGLGGGPDALLLLLLSHIAPSWLLLLLLLLLLLSHIAPSWLLLTPLSRGCGAIPPSPNPPAITASSGKGNSRTLRLLWSEPGRCGGERGRPGT